MFGDLEKQLLNDLLADGNLTAGMALMDRLNDLADLRMPALSISIGEFVEEVTLFWSGVDVSTHDIEADKEEALTWSSACDTCLAISRLREKVRSLFWREVSHLGELTEIQSFIDLSLSLTASDGH